MSAGSLEHEHSTDQINTAACFGRFLLGYFKKACIADQLSSFVQSAYADPARLNRAEAWLAIFAFAFQIYADFSGYCDMAIGLGGLLGYTLPENFSRPYLSRNIRQFWRGWNISVSTWFRDYVYTPLGGNRGGLSKTCRNLMITAVASGLWHGGNWTFIVWGVLHGLSLCVDRVTSAMTSRVLPVWLATPLTFTWVCVLFSIFRAPDLNSAAKLLRIATGISGGARNRVQPASSSWTIFLSITYVLAGVSGNLFRFCRWPEWIVYSALGAASAAVLALAYVSVPKLDVLVGVGLSMALGVFAGIFPALHAMRLRVADALRRM